MAQRYRRQRIARGTDGKGERVREGHDRLSREAYCRGGRRREQEVSRGNGRISATGRTRDFRHSHGGYREADGPPFGATLTEDLDRFKGLGQ